MPCSRAGCEVVLKPNPRRKGTMCKRCCELERTAPPRHCTGCGASISTKKRNATGLCRSCAPKRAERRASVSAKLIVVHRDPNFQAKRKVSMSKGQRRRLSDPAEMARARAHCAALGKRYGGANNRDQAAVNRRTQAERLADIPLAYRDEYISLGRKGFSAEERKKMVLDLAARAVERHYRKSNQENEK